MIEVGVTNPVVGLSTVGIAPFFNLSQEPIVDGRRFALAYYTELQKTPGFQVIPVGVVEQSMFDHKVDLASPMEAVQTADRLGVDVIVAGAVTDYHPYYPPRIGLQTSWYSPRPWTFFPGVPTNDFARKTATRSPKSKSGRSSRWKFWGSSTGHSEESTPTADHEPCVPPAVRGQSPDAGLIREPYAAEPITTTELEGTWDPLQPLMSYTRLFDGSDARLTARLRDYVELTGDLRSGGWEAYLHRSEDFIRFASHLMIVEMLQLHGGEARRRYVVKHRKHQ